MMPARLAPYLLLILAAALLPAAGARAQLAPLRIGVSAPLQLQAGRDMVAAADLAIEELNARGGVLGRPLELVAGDETDSPQLAAEAARRLLLRERVDVLVGGHSGAGVTAQWPVVQDARVVFLSVGTAAPALTERVRADYEHLRFLFRVAPPNARQQARALADFLGGLVRGELGLTRIAVIGENLPWVRELIVSLRRTAGGSGLDLRLAELVDPQAPDFAAVVPRLRDSGAQFLLLLLPHAASEPLLRLVQEARLPLLAGGVDGRAAQADHDPRSDGVAVAEIVATLGLRAPLAPRTIAFWDAFVRRAGRVPGPAAWGAYNAVTVYAEAVSRARGTAADAVIQELERGDFTGVTGRIQFDENHDLRSGAGAPALYFVQWQEPGERVVVWPRQLRAGHPLLAVPLRH